MSRWRRQLSRRHNRARARAPWTALALHKCHCRSCGYLIEVSAKFCPLCVEAGCHHWPQTPEELAAVLTGTPLGFTAPVSFSGHSACNLQQPRIVKLRVFNRALTAAERAQAWREGIESLASDGEPKR